MLGERQTKGAASEKQSYKTNKNVGWVVGRWIEIVLLKSSGHHCVNSAAGGTLKAS